MGTRTRTTLDSARAKELAANRPAASQRRQIDYSALARLRWAKAGDHAVRIDSIRVKANGNISIGLKKEDEK